MNDSDPSPVCGLLSIPSMTDFPGRLAAVLFTSGCNFRCGFCHNSGLLRRRPGMTWRQLSIHCDALGENWVDGAVISGGEPTVEPRLKELIDFLHGRGWAVKLDTNGGRPDVLQKMLPHVEAVAMDVKAPLPDYPRVAGFRKSEQVRRSVEVLKRAAVPCTFRTTVIDGVHSNEDMLLIGDMLRGARHYVLQPFIPRQDLPDPAYRRLSRTDPDRLKELRRRLSGVAEVVEIAGEM